MINKYMPKQPPQKFTPQELKEIEREHIEADGRDAIEREMEEDFEVVIMGSDMNGMNVYIVEANDLEE